MIELFNIFGTLHDIDHIRKNSFAGGLQSLGTYTPPRSRRFEHARYGKRYLCPSIHQLSPAA